MAIFVESTFESAKADASRRRHLRHLEHIRVARKLQNLLIMLCSGHQDTFRQQNKPKPSLLHRAFATNNDDIHSKVVMQSDVTLKHYLSPQEFERIIDEPQVQQMLIDMEVSVGDWLNLFDVLDADGNRRLNIGEIVHGLMKLRGGADKCDVVSLVLMVRATQAEIGKLIHAQREQGQIIEEIWACLRTDGLSPAAGWDASWDMTSVHKIPC